MHKQPPRGFIELLLLVIIIALCVGIVRSCDSFKDEDVLEYERIVELHAKYDPTQCKESAWKRDQYKSVTCGNVYHELVVTPELFTCRCDPGKEVVVPDLPPIPERPKRWYERKT